MRTLRVVAAAVVLTAFSAVGATSAQAEVKAPISAAGWQWSAPTDSAAGWQWSAPTDSAAGWQWSASGWQW